MATSPKPIAAAGSHARQPQLYTPEQRLRRDRSPWTIVQGVLAPVQFLAFLISLFLVARYFLTGDGLAAAETSILIKTGLLLSIMITGAIWEKQVFGQWLFAPAFFWEDVFSMLVIALHLSYVVMLVKQIGSTSDQLLTALAAYTTYVINAGQFLWKLRIARIQNPEEYRQRGAGTPAAGFVIAGERL